MPDFSFYPRVGGGTVRVITGTDPAAGVEITETVPAGRVWKLNSFRAQLVTDATVANRTLRLIIDDGTTTLFDYYSALASQAASQTIAYNFSIGLSAPTVSSALGVANAPLGEGFILGPGYRIRTLASGLVAGDNWGAPVFQVVQYDA